jgi:deazaflavin-dependent oxidoreductase (nitroreductase family)
VSRVIMVLLGAAGSVAAFVVWWRRHPRFGTAAVNRVVNPWLVRQGVTDVTHGEIGLLEHVGRVTGTTRVTPVRPVDTTDGVRVVMPLGAASQWGRNVIAAGHCRMQRGGVVIELDSPRIVNPRDVEGMPALPARLMSWLGFRYLLLRRFDERPGTLGDLAAHDGLVPAGAVDPSSDEVRRSPQRTR